ncbi:FKBP-type peptidyl-prolyl cis-trans isomerase [Mucilaginibacter jinjuensis]|uniref:Peptidyl-prolyl cis-trans isomerase n=1 Tax=Mucilaginibacter jinjuensis TaxID=1176721 RepID=A0ABY7T8A4_9SPHI|nr:FKBP-type peptidyl-prolyl cis-trans isomerase [Mucilaginibacter jinjuensis]WCT11452.1 FKBP-type peptidyl-prolyl cis-trans isomerase [Mucilaginibacter jinjuensis]
MKQTLTTLLLLCTIGLMSLGLISCHKDNNNVDIKTYDQQQIQNYISANGLTGMKRDLDGGDTTGIYYQILRPGKGKVLQYSDAVSIVFTYKTLDGQYVSADTVLNHAYSYVGHFTPPAGLMLALKTILVNDGAQARILIPSHLAYGTSGTGTGSTRLPGNESLDYYINMINSEPNLPNSEPIYDDMVIQNYMKTNGLTGYTKTADGLYYKIVQVGTGTVPVTENSVVGLQYTGKLFNGTIFDGQNFADTSSFPVNYKNMIPGWQEGLKLVTKGAKLSLIIPSGLAYGKNPATFGASFTVQAPPANSCLYYDFNIMSVTN